jgi:hypothetical protein
MLTQSREHGLLNIDLIEGDGFMDTSVIVGCGRERRQKQRKGDDVGVEE